MRASVFPRIFQMRAMGLIIYRDKMASSSNMRFKLKNCESKAQFCEQRTTLVFVVVKILHQRFYIQNLADSSSWFNNRYIFYFQLDCCKCLTTVGSNIKTGKLVIFSAMERNESKQKHVTLQNLCQHRFFTFTVVTAIQVNH